MHKREITHIVKTESLSKIQLVVMSKCSFCCYEVVIKPMKIEIIELPPFVLNI